MEFFFREGDFGIHIPFENVLKAGKPFLTTAVNAHLWCGEDIAWIQAKRFSGKKPYCYLYLTEGSIFSYDIDRNIDRAAIGMDYRGDLVLNPTPQPIMPGECLKTEFAVCLDEREPEDFFQTFDGHIALIASSYTSLGGEPITVTAKYTGEIKTATVILDEQPLPFEQKNNTLTFTVNPAEFREYTVYVTINGKRTWLRVNALPKLEDLLSARAKFIARKQQYHRDGSHLDGAYLIYESQNDSQYFSHYFHDHNAGRERICMGLTVIEALLLQPDKELEDSLKKFVSFVERELFDLETGEVFESENRNNTFVRIYNYPWFACFYLELYHLWGKPEHLQYAVKIIRQYYAQNGKNQDSQCIPMLELVTELEKAGETETANELKGYFISHAESIISRKLYGPSAEGVCGPGTAETLVSYFAQTYLLTGNKKYFEMLTPSLEFAETYMCRQPDVHMHRMGIRHWDGYWFGSYMQYGDLYPHQWNCIAGEMYHFLGLALNQPKYKAAAKDVFLNNLCGYKADGFAPSSYLYPHRITLYSQKGVPNPNMPFGVGYGRRYDTWCNEQDWSIYYAAKRLIFDKKK